MTILDVRVTGGQTFPLPPPVDGTPLVDPVAVGLLDFLGWWLNKDINPHLAQLPPRSSVAVPEANCFPYDPGEYWVRNAKPALYVWWQSARDVEYTLVLRRRIATYGLMYVADEVLSPDGAHAYSGIVATVSRSLSNACEAGRHDDYGYGSDANGTALWKSLGIEGWRIAEMQHGRMAPRPSAGARSRGQVSGHVERSFPCAMGTLTVTEEIGRPALRDPENVTTDWTVSIRTNEQGDLDNAVEIMQRYTPGPDGTEQE